LTRLKIEKSEREKEGLGRVEGEKKGGKEMREKDENQMGYFSNVESSFFTGFEYLL